MFFALLDLVFGVSLADPPADTRNTPALQFFASALPLWLWAGLWLAAGGLCMAGAFARHDRWAFAAAIAIKVLWGGTNLLAWLFAGVDRAYVAAAIWLALAAFVMNVSSWPEPPTPSKPGGEAG